MAGRLFTNIKPIHLSLISGVLLALSYPPLPCYLFAFIGLAPLLYVYEEKPRHPLLLTLLSFFIYHTASNWWISSWQANTDPYLLISGLAIDLVHPFFFLVPMGIYRVVRSKLGLTKALIAFPFIWTAFEWAHSLGDLGYPWLTLGYTQMYKYLFVQAADIAGVWGLSFLIAACNAVVFALIIKLRNNSETRTKLFKEPYTILLCVHIVILLFIPVIYGVIRVSNLNLNETEKKINFSVVQPNIDPWQKWVADPMSQIGKYKQLQDSLIQAQGKAPDVSVWSETAITYLNTDINLNHNLVFLNDWLDSNKMSLLTGFTDMVLFDEKPANSPTARYWPAKGKYYESYNSAILLNPDSVSRFKPQIYHKMRLTPFGERLPYAELFSFAISWFEWNVGISSWSKGNEQKNLILRNGVIEAKIAPIICIESIYPDFVRGFTAKGADVLTVITNDGWYDYTYGPEQHFQIAAMRAIENRRYLVRCANTGVSGFISPTGKTIKKAPQYTSIAVSESIPLINTKSLYVEIGDLLPQICSFATLVLFFFSIIYRKKIKIEPY